MIAQCCRTCAHYQHRTETRGYCMVKTTDAGIAPLVNAGDCCAMHTDGKTETYAPRESETWQCVGCDHNCRCELDAGFIPVQCLVFALPWKLPDGTKRGESKWVRVNP